MIYYIGLKVGLGLRTLKIAQWTIINQDCGLAYFLFILGPLGLLNSLGPSVNK